MTEKIELRQVDLTCPDTGEICPSKQAVRDTYTSVEVPGHDDQTRAIALADADARSFELVKIEAAARRVGCKDSCAWVAMQASVEHHPAAPKPHSRLRQLASRALHHSD